MALHTEDAEVERLAARVAERAHESETEVVRRALEERMEKLATAPERPKRRNLLEYLEREVWPNIPPDKLGKPSTKDEEEDILGIGPSRYFGGCHDPLPGARP
jgi:antitoxin VapB